MSYATTPGQGIGYRMAMSSRMPPSRSAGPNGAKTVTVDVGVIIDEGWKKILTARGYEYVAAEGAWIKLIKVE